MIHLLYSIQWCTEVSNRHCPSQIWSECGVDVAWMWCGCGVNVAWMWYGCGLHHNHVDVAWMWRGIGVELARSDQYLESK